MITEALRREIEEASRFAIAGEVVDHVYAVIARAVKEQAAKVADTVAREISSHGAAILTAEDIAAAIRAMPEEG